MFLSRKCITVVSARIIHSRRRCYCIRSDNEQLLSHNELQMHTHSNCQSRRRSRFCVISFSAKTFHLSFAGGGRGGERKMIREMNGIFLFCVKIDSSSICESLMALEPFEQINLLQFAQLESWVGSVNIYDPIAAINNLWIEFAFAELAVDYDNLAANASQRKVISTWLRIQRVPMAERISRGGRGIWMQNYNAFQHGKSGTKGRRMDFGLWTIGLSNIESECDDGDLFIDALSAANQKRSIFLRRDEQWSRTKSLFPTTFSGWPIFRCICAFCGGRERELMKANSTEGECWSISFSFSAKSSFNTVCLCPISCHRHNTMHRVPLSYAIQMENPFPFSIFTIDWTHTLTHESRHTSQTFGVG